MFLRLAAQVRVDGPVPELFDGFPVFNLAAPDDEAYLVALLVLESFVSNVEVQL